MVGPNNLPVYSLRRGENQLKAESGQKLHAYISQEALSIYAICINPTCNSCVDYMRSSQGINGEESAMGLGERMD